MPGKSTLTGIAIAASVLALSSGTAGAQALTPAEQEAFLKSARVVEARPVGTGVTETWRLTLSQDGWTHDASFQSVDVSEFIKELPDGRREFHFVDSYRYNIAAYRLAQLIGLTDMVPVSVPRAWRGEAGALTWWVDDVQMDENERIERGIDPPEDADWSRQIYRARLFTELIHDTDRNRGNLLVTSGWRLWMIDFTRAFRRSKELQRPEELRRCDEELFERLRELSTNRDRIEAALSEFLSPPEVDGLSARAGTLVNHFERQIAERGRDQVLYGR